MSRSTTAALLAAGLAVLSACGDSARRLPTTPPETAHRQLSTAPACQPSDGAYITDPAVIGALFSQSVAGAARTLAIQVQATCPSTVAALDYAKAILGWRGAGAVTAPDAALWSYVGRIFAYDGFSVDASSAVLGPQGFAGVCDPAGCTLVAPARTSGVRIFPGALTTRVLVTGRPASCAPATQGTTLQLVPQCVEITASPTTGPSLQLAPPGAIVQVCMVEGTPAYLYTPNPVTGIKRARLGRLSPENGRVELRPLAAPFFAADCDPAIVASARPRSGALESFLAGGSMFARLARRAVDAVTPEPLYAGHGGLGTLPGSTTRLSLYGPVDPFLFLGTFTADAIGQPPAVPDNGRGSWTVTAGASGGVTVQPALGDLQSKLAVLRQTGPTTAGNSAAQLVATMASQPGQAPFPTFGRFAIRWRSVVGSPRVFDAPLLLLDSRGRVLARIDYRPGASGGSGTVQFDRQEVAGWTQDVSQTFQITVDLNAGTTSFGIVAPTGAVTTLVTAAPYVDAAVTPSVPFDLARLAWSLRGFGAQAIGVDDVQVFALTSG